jgi:hypothetical protein
MKWGEAFTWLVWVLLCLLCVLMLVGIATAQPPAIPMTFKGPPPVPGSKGSPPIEAHRAPFEAVLIAQADLEGLKLAAQDTTTVRYISLVDVTNHRSRRQVKSVVDFLLNSFNTKTRTFVLTTPLQDCLVLRLDLAAYHIDPKAWDFLAENGSGRVPIPDPYFHENKLVHEDIKEVRSVTRQVRQRVLRPWFNGRYVEDWETKEVVEEQAVPTGKKIKKFVQVAQARWLALDGGKALAYVTEATQTKNPILRADWFLYYASVAPAYYELLGIRLKIVDGKIVGGQDELEKIAGVDFKRGEKSQVAAIADSKIVALANRILIRFPTINGPFGGYFWTSFDTDLGFGAEDYVDNAATFDRPKFAAQEIIFSNPNGTQAYAVTDNQRNLLNLAVANIAIHGDKMPSRLQDKQIYAGVQSCMLCHYNGMIDVKDKVRDLALDKTQIGLFIVDKFGEEVRKDKDLARRIYGAFFETDVQALVRFDNAMYGAAVKQVTEGMSGLQLRDAFEEALWKYSDAFITPEQAAREAGLVVPKLLGALKVAPARLDDDRLSPHVTALLQTPPVVVSRTQWEAFAFASMMKYLVTLPRN